MEKKGFFKKIKEGLSKTRQGITSRVDDIIKYYKEIDEEFYEELEEVLVTADIGVNTTMEIMDYIRDRVKEEKTGDTEKIRSMLKEKILDILGEEKEITLNPPSVILVVGVNGVGKTTTIGKLAYKYKHEGKEVIAAAGDTFRAAAGEQLEVWCNRAGIDIISHEEGADPAAVVFDGIQAAKARKKDILICDTAGRLHNKKNLMNELEKISRIIEREYPQAHKEVLLVLDATTGQNAITQAKLFKEVVGVTGIVLTKLDGTAKGGIVVAIKSELDIPIYYVGVGEKADDLQPFIGEVFVNALFED